MDVTSLCRSCMKELTIWEKNFDQKTMDLFSFCTNIQVAPDDPLPQKFCSQCTVAIQSCCSFITTAREVDIKLRDTINSFVKTENSIHELETNNDHDFDFTDDVQEPEESESLKLEKIKIEYVPEVEQMNVAAMILEQVLPEGKHNKLNKEVFPCVECNKLFTRKGNLDNHMFNTHPDVVEAANPLSFQHHKPRKPHRSRHRCQYCDKKFSNYKILNEHERTHGKWQRKNSAGSDKYTCNYCNKEFTQKSRLLTHLYVHDNTLKPFLCDICGSRFSSEQPLINHRRVHTGEKPFKCEECEYTCAIQSNLRRHKRAHRGERSHQCVECGKGFIELSSLKKHMHQHTGEQPYKCPHCEKRYKNPGKRKIHLMKAHGLDPSQIPRMAKDGLPSTRRYVTEEPRSRESFTLLADRIKKREAQNQHLDSGHTNVMSNT